MNLSSLNINSVFAGPRHVSNSNYSVFLKENRARANMPQSLGLPDKYQLDESAPEKPHSLM